MYLFKARVQATAQSTWVPYVYAVGIGAVATPRTASFSCCCVGLLFHISYRLSFQNILRKIYWSTNVFHNCRYSVDR